MRHNLNVDGKMDPQRNRVMVLGFDGGTFDVFEPLSGMGHMPRFSQLMEKGVWGPLWSVTPPVTGPAWASFLTGKQPGKHGLFDFLKRTPGQVGRQPVNFSDIKSSSLLNLVGQSGDMSVCAFNVPVTYPPIQVDGIVVSGMLTPSPEVGFTWPPELKGELEEEYGPYVLDVFWQRFSDQSAEAFLRDVIDYESQKLSIARDLYARRPWDLFIAVFTGVDRISHALWHVISAIIDGRELPTAQERLKPLVLEYFRLLDEQVGKLVEGAGENVSIFFMSDHGFGPLTKKFCINEWLREKGLLEYDSSTARKINRYAGLRRYAKDLLIRFPVVKSYLTRTVRTPMRGRLRSYRFLDLIDWEKTKAYSASGTEQGIYINLKGREPWGTVHPEDEYEQLRSEIIELLREIVDPDDGKPLVSHVYRREELYEGPFVESAPDIVFFLGNGECLADVKLSGRLWQGVDWITGRGTHRKDGMFLACGAGIGKRHRAEMDIIDLAPIVLFLLGLPIPDDMDGKVRTDILDESLLGGRRPEFAAASGSGPDEGGTISEAEEQEVLKRLEDLGYL